MNLKIDKEDLDFIRSLEDFDLTMFLSEVHEFGWSGETGAKNLLTIMKETIPRRKEREESCNQK